MKYTAIHKDIKDVSVPYNDNVNIRYIYVNTLANAFSFFFWRVGRKDKTGVQDQHVDSIKT